MDIMSVALQLKEVGGDAVKKALDKVRESTKGLGAELRKLDDSVGTVGQALAGLATGALVGATLQKIAQETSAAQFAQAQLAAALKSTNNAAGQSVDALNAHAEALAKVTTFGDDAITEAQSLLLTFTKIQGDVFPKATEAVANVAQAMGTDLRGAAIQVGKALNDPILGVTALQRAGIQFTQSQRDQIKVLVESGRQVEAQRIVLKELETQFGGSAQAARNTLGGALQGLANDFGNLFEVTQKDSQPAIAAISALSKVLQDLAPVMSGLIVRSIPQLVGAVGGLAAVFVTYTAIAKGAALTTAAFGSAVLFLNTAMTSAAGVKALITTIAAFAIGYGTYTLIVDKLEQSISSVSGSLQTTSAAQNEARAFMDRLTPSTLAGASAFGILSDKVLQANKAFRNIGAGPAGPVAKPEKPDVPVTPVAPPTEEERANKLKLEAERRYGEMLKVLSDMRNISEKVRRDQLALEAKMIKPAAVDVGRVNVSPLLASLDAARNAMTAGYEENILKPAKALGQQLNQILSAGIANAFQALAARGGTFGDAFKALGQTILSGIGDMLIQLGTSLLPVAALLKGIREAFASLNPYAMAAAAIGLIALGGAMKGAASRIATSGMGAPVSAGGFGYASAGGSSGITLPGISYMPTTASSMGARVMQQQPVNVTVIGPNDPSAQRAIQELITNANRRGNTFAV